MTQSETGSSFVYVTYIRSTPEKVWAALTRKEFMTQYWFNMHIESDWRVGSPWQLTFTDGRIADSGVVLEFDPPRRLVLSWTNQWMPEMTADGETQCVFELEVVKDTVKLTVAHQSKLTGAAVIRGVAEGWPKILSNLKSYLETGSSVLE